MKELEARVRALIPRDRRQVRQEVLQVGDLVLDTATLRLARNVNDMQVSPIGMKLLTILVRNSRGGSGSFPRRGPCRSGVAFVRCSNPGFGSASALQGA